MLQMLKTHLESEGAFTGELSPYMLQMTDCVGGAVSFSMKLSVAVSELMLYASQFRRYIKLPADKTPIPVNAISFVLAASGANKDRTVKSIRSSLSDGYYKIDLKRKELATQAAIQKAKDEGIEDPDKWENHKAFYSKPAALFAAMTNSAAYIDHLAGMESLPLGAGFMYTGELGSEMQTNPDMISSIRVMSELYDVGYKEAKPLKDKTAQTPEIKNLAVSALFIGSHDNILFDEKIKKDFRTEFSTKLARRSFFTFSPEEVITPSYSSVPEMLKAKTEREEREVAARGLLNESAAKIAECNLKHGCGEVLTIDPEAKDLYEIYQEYNDEVSRTISKRFPISILVRKHNHWKALKLAGALAIFNCQKSITKQDLIHAISYIELIDGDMAKFETELVKEKYEVFCDYMRSLANEEGKSSITLHGLRKLQYITGTGSPATKMKELIDMASSYDPLGVYSISENTVHYETIVKTEVTGASFLEVSGTKEQRAKACASGYSYAESTFVNLKNLLSMDLAFTPFALKEGVRGRENIISGTTWICFDVDDSNLRASEVHEIIEDVNHHIALTSDPDNEFKFRVIVQLDASVQLEPLEWKYFIESVSDFLGLPIDKLPQSQIFFGYAGREVLSTTDADAIEIKDHITYAMTRAAEKTPAKEMTPKEKSAQLGAPFATFEAAFEARTGSGSRLLYAAARKSHGLGASIDDTINLVRTISDYWDSPFPPHRLRALEDQIRNF